MTDLLEYNLTKMTFPLQERPEINTHFYGRTVSLPQLIPIKDETKSEVCYLYTNHTKTKKRTSPFVLRNLIYCRVWNRVEQACRSSPSQAKVADKLGDLPLHEACQQAAPLHVIKNLLLVHPDGIKTKGFCGRLPLHYASYNKPCLDTIKLLLNKYPESASIKDSDGRLPIHLAVIRNVPKEVIQTLIMAFPESLITHNNFGSTPQMLARTNSTYSIFHKEDNSVGMGIYPYLELWWDSTLYTLSPHFTDGRQIYICRSKLIEDQKQPSESKYTNEQSGSKETPRSHAQVWGCTTKCGYLFCTYMSCITRYRAHRTVLTICVHLKQ